MIRSVLQFIGFASMVVWSTLFLGTIFSITARADVAPPLLAGCGDCYACNQAKSGCVYGNYGRGCTDNQSCNCNTNNGSSLCVTAT